MKPEKKSWTRALFAYAGGEKKKPVLSVVLSVLSVTLGLAPFYCMYGLLRQSAAGTATSAPVCQASARKKSDRPLPARTKKSPGSSGSRALETIFG